MMIQISLWLLRLGDFLDSLRLDISDGDYLASPLLVPASLRGRRKVRVLGLMVVSAPLR